MRPKEALETIDLGPKVRVHMASAIDVGFLNTRRRFQRESCGGRTRLISNEAGRALEMLGHAIDYLTDEYVHGSKRLSSSDPQVEAIQLLMNLNRQVYFECPTVPTLREKLEAFFHKMTV